LPEELVQIIGVVVVQNLFQSRHPLLNVKEPFYLGGVHVKIRYDAPKVGELSRLLLEQRLDPFRVFQNGFVLVTQNIFALIFLDIQKTKI
jgi:hypothetical protein